MERVQSLQKMQVLTRQKANLAAQLEACPWPPFRHAFVHSNCEDGSCRYCLERCRALLETLSDARTYVQVANQTNEKLLERLDAQETEQAAVKAAVSAVTRLWEELNADIRFIAQRLPQQVRHRSSIAAITCSTTPSRTSVVCTASGSVGPRAACVCMPYLTDVHMVSRYVHHVRQCFPLYITCHQLRPSVLSRLNLSPKRPWRACRAQAGEWGCRRPGSKDGGRPRGRQH
jgi:hypothetical protein